MDHWLDYYGYCRDSTYNFHLEASSRIECLHSIEHLQYLNPPMQKLVKKEITKWLDAGVV